MTIKEVAQVGVNEQKHKVNELLPLLINHESSLKQKDIFNWQCLTLRKTHVFKSSFIMCNSTKDIFR